MAYVDVHFLHTVPPSCINRDDTGSPKTATYGGVRRARVSSQAWKRATREYFKDHVDAALLGQRTKRLVDMVSDQLLETHSDLDRAEAVNLAEIAVQAAGLKTEKDRNSDRINSAYLLLVSAEQTKALAEVVEQHLTEAEGDAAEAGKSIKKAKKAVKAALSGQNSIDLALFGRMVADDTDLNVDASCQVAHALSVHPAEPEFDYFTAVDDLQDNLNEEGRRDAGAGMIGTVEFTSATLYRYASINVEDLFHNLGSKELVERAIAAFIDGFARSMPTGKVNTFGNFTLPEGVVISIRQDQPLSLVGAFERPVSASTSGGFINDAAEGLVSWAEDLENQYGDGRTRIWSAGLGEANETLRGLATEETASFRDIPASVASAAVRELAD